MKGRPTVIDKKRINLKNKVFGTKDKIYKVRELVRQDLDKDETKDSKRKDAEKRTNGGMNGKILKY